jgi:hypothetical protein
MGRSVSTFDNERLTARRLAAAALPYGVAAALALWPVTAAVAEIGRVSPAPLDLVFRAASVAAVVAMLFTAALARASGAPRWASLVVAFSVLASTEYASVVNTRRLPTGIWHLPVFVAIVVLVAAALWKRPRLCERGFKGAALLAFGSLIPVVVVLVAAQRHANDVIPGPGERLSALSVVASNRRLPDIYHLVVDGFGRPDVLRQQYNLDLSAFTAELTSRGFEVDPHRGLANYSQTYVSLASMLNGTYLDELRGPFEESASRLPALAWLHGAEVLRTLKSLGYEIHLVRSDFEVTSVNPLADTCDCPRPVWGEFESLIIRNTVLGASGLGGLDYAPHRQFIERQLGSLAMLRAPGDHPRLVLAHVLNPHEPFVFDASGRPVAPSRAFLFGDGTLFRGTDLEYRDGYRAQAQFMASRILELTARWRALSGPASILIVHGDHGPRRLFDAHDARRSDAREVMPVLLAVHWGTTTGQHVTSLVNVYRELFRRFGLPVAQLEDRAYMSDFVRPYRFLPVDLATLRVEEAQ